MKAAAKKTLIGIGGGVVLLAGIAMIFLPGPAFIVIPAGLAILSTEFEWAHRVKEKTKERFDRAREKHRARRQARAA
jgi:uncharacterized protein (TIGR02611 family)